MCGGGGGAGVHAFMSACRCVCFKLFSFVFSDRVSQGMSQGSSTERIQVGFSSNENFCHFHKDVREVHPAVTVPADR